MKSYELIIETRQPSCGGKPPKVYQFLDIQTDDPETYVRQREPDAELEITAGTDGSLTVEARKGVRQVSYQFTEA